MNETEAKARRVMKELVRAAIDVQALGNRLLHLGSANRPHGNDVREHALALARTARAMGGLGMAGTAELQSFFGDTLHLPAGVRGEGYDADDDDYLRLLRDARPGSDMDGMARGLALAAEFRAKRAAATSDRSHPD